MADEPNTQAAGSIETKSEFGATPSELVKNWLQAIKLADTEEDGWRKDAEDAFKIYRAAEADRSKYNILYANTQTINPALYNSEPTPDIRKRFGDGAPQMGHNGGPPMQQPGAAPAPQQPQPPPPDPAKQASQALERGISIQAEMYGFDDCMKAAVFDRTLAGRGVTRLRVVSGQNGSKRVTCEPVKWDDFRRGPATAWAIVPWVAFRHRMTREELNKLNPKVGPKVTLDVTVADEKQKDKQELPDIFKRALVWEIWDLGTREVLFIAESYTDAPVAKVPDPYDLRGFFPCPKPLYSMPMTDSLVPVCDYRIWKHLAEEMNDITGRIAGIVKVMKLRGLYDGAFGAAIGKMQDLNDGELAPVEDAARILQQGGIDKAIWIWPVDMAIKVVEGLYEARERCKQTIFEVTGVADILRGQTDPNETLGAQQIKAQWGSLRLQDGQKDVANYARDLFRMMADLLAKIWTPPEWAAATNIQVTPETQKLLQSDLQREFSIEIETDSTIRADLSRSQQNVAGFVTGLGQFMEGVAPAVQAGFMPPEIAIKYIGVFSRNFKLGREAEDLTEEWVKAVEQKAANPQPPPPDPKVEAEKVKAQATMEKAKADVALVQVKAKAEQDKTQMDLQAKQAELGMRMQEMQAEFAMLQQEFGLKQQELGLKRQEQAGDMALAEREHEMRTREQMMGREAAEHGHGLKMEVMDAQAKAKQAAANKPNGGAR